MAVVIGLDGCKGECRWCCEGSGVRMVARVSVSGCVCGIVRGLGVRMAVVIGVDGCKSVGGIVRGVESGWLLGCV